MMRFIILCVCLFAYTGCELFIGIDDKQFDSFVNFDYMRDRIKDSYALLEWKEKENNFNWDSKTEEARKRIRSTMPIHEFIEILTEALAVFKDPHIAFTLPNGTSINSGIRGLYSYSHKRFYKNHSGFIRSRIYNHYLSPHLAKYGKNKVLMYGNINKKKTANKDIGYIQIRTFSDNKDLTLTTVQKWAHEIDAIVATLMDTDALILDIRQNPGGYPGNMLHIAGRFAREKRHFMDMYMKNGPGRHDFAKPYQWYVEPQGPRQYTKPILLITDGGTSSNGEYLTLALRRFNYVTHFGQATKGIMGYVMVTQMPNGLGLSYTTGYSEGFTDDNKKKNYEQYGIPPKKEMKYDDIRNYPNYKEQGGEIDPMLEEAIKTLL